MRIWVTRAQPAADATAARLTAKGHQAIVAPVLECQPLANARLDLSRAGSIAFTSQNAVAAYAAISARRDLPVFTTGEATAQAARKIGFTRVAAAQGGINELAILILAEDPAGEVVWPGPAEPAGDLAGKLALGGVTASLQPVYRTVETGAAMPDNLDGLIVHSPKAARAAAKRLTAASVRTLALFAISDAAAAPLANLPFFHVAVAPLPNETALLALVAG